MTRRPVALVLALAIAGGAGCGSPTPVSTPTSTVPTTTSTSTVAGAATSSTSSTSSAVPAPIPSGAVGFSDGDNGRSVTVAAGERVTVILHSADFVFAPPADPAVLQVDGSPTVTAGAPSCVEEPGSGCGVVVASFVAVGPGETVLAADRTACVEPRCPADTAHWTLRILVETTAAGTESETTEPEIPGSEIRGTVRFSPVCPVERFPPDPACAPRPGPADIEVVRPDGTVAATATAGDDGDFAVAVAAGTYSVRASVPGTAAAIGGGCQADPPEVTVPPGSPATVAVACDTGIR